MKIKITRILSILLIILFLLFNACSLSGLYIGGLVDFATPDKIEVAQFDYKHIDLGTKITIHRIDSIVSVGNLIEITDLDISLETNFGVEIINLDNISNIEVDTKKNAARTLFKLGLALDAAYLLWAICCFE